MLPKDEVNRAYIFKTKKTNCVIPNLTCPNSLKIKSKMFMLRKNL